MGPVGAEQETIRTCITNDLRFLHSAVGAESGALPREVSHVLDKLLTQLTRKTGLSAVEIISALIERLSPEERQRLMQNVFHTNRVEDA